MYKKRLKWVLFAATPIILLLPFQLNWNFTKYFKSIILHPTKTGITTLNFYDATRNRPLITEVWYPVDADAPARATSGIWTRCDEARDGSISNNKQKYPLIMISHGNLGDRFNISWLAEILAANGYIAAAMDHYGNTWNNKIPEYHARPWERPLDISFVVDQLLTHSPFKDRIDEKKIGFAGYSLGGATGMWVAGAMAAPLTNQQMTEACLQELTDTVSRQVVENTNFQEAHRSFADKRFNAFVLMAPALGWLFDEKSLEIIASPMFIVAPAKDKICPTERNARIFAQKLSRATLHILPGEADHYVFLNCASQLGKRLLEPRFHEDHSTLGRKKIHEQIGKNAVEFYDNHLR